MGEITKEIRDWHHHDERPDAAHYGPGTTWTCSCGDEWDVIAVPPGAYRPMHEWARVYYDDNGTRSTPRP